MCVESEVANRACLSPDFGGRANQLVCERSPGMDAVEDAWLSL
jgi:hypothetical protein